MDVARKRPHLLLLLSAITFDGGTVKISAFNINANNASASARLSSLSSSLLLRDSSSRRPPIKIERSRRRRQQRILKAASNNNNINHNRHDDDDDDKPLSTSSTTISSKSSTIPAATSVTSQAALIAGTTIGGGFLALPTATAPCGALPSALGLVGVWFYLLGVAFSLSNSLFIMRRYADADADIWEEAPTEGGETNNGVLQTTTSTTTTKSEPKSKKENISIFSLVRECFGDTAGILGGLLFLLLLNVTLVAQLSKVGTLLEGTLFPIVVHRQYWTAAFSIGITTVCYIGTQRNIERVNDGLTLIMLLSFASLVGLAGGSGWTMDGLGRADYRSLLPPFLSFLSGTSSEYSSSSSISSGSPWAIPIFIQLLIYNEVVPLISSRLGDERKVQRAILLGSSVPLIMCLIWSCVALGLVPYDPSTIINGGGSSGILYDPLTNLGDIVRSKSGGSIGKLFLLSVNVLAGSAICTTVIGSILASTQYFDDMIANFIGRFGMIASGNSSGYTNVTTAADEKNVKKILPQKYQKIVTHILSVAPSTVVALWGSSNLYYYATSFAGEYPCTLLYGLIPPLCNLRLRWKYRNNDDYGTGGAMHWKDVAMQVLLATVSLAILIVNSIPK